MVVMLMSVVCWLAVYVSWQVSPLFWNFFLHVLGCRYSPMKAIELYYFRPTFLMIFWFDFERILRPLRQQLKDALINHDRLANTCKVDLKFRIYLIEENNLIPPSAQLWAWKDLITCSFILYYFLTSVFAFFFVSCPAADQPSLNMAKMFLSVFFNQQKWKES